MFHLEHQKDLKGERYKMVGVFPWVSRMLEKRKSLGYRAIRVIDNCPFLKKGQKIRGHEYHYSEIDEPPQRVKRVYRITHNPPSPPFSKEGKGGLSIFILDGCRSLLGKLFDYVRKHQVQGMVPLG